MYWKLRTEAITILLILVLGRSTLAGLAEDQYAVAAHHYSSARWDLAVDEFTVFLQRYSQHEQADTVVFFLAEALVQLNRYPAAHDRFAEYLSRSPNGKYALQSQFRLGETLYMANRYEEARDALERFRLDHPEDALCAYVLPYLGEIALVAARPEEARAVFSDALQRHPTGPLANESRFGLARSLEALGDHEGAIRFYQFLADSDQPTAMSDDALLQMAILLYQQDEFDKAMAALRRHRERFPASKLAAHAAYWLGLSLTSVGSHAAAAETLSAATDKFADHELAPAMAYAAADALRRQQDLSTAQRYLELVVAQHADSTWADDALQTLVQLAWQQGDCQQVQTLASQFVAQYSQSPLLPLVRQTVARAQLKQGEYERAIAVLESLVTPVDLGPRANDPVAIGPHEDPSPTLDHVAASPAVSAGTTRYYLALAYLGARRHQDALNLLDQLTDVTEPRELVEGIQVARASALLALERYEQAIEVLQVYLASETAGVDREKCRAQLAVTCARLDRWAEAERVFSQLQREHQDQTLYLTTIEYLSELAFSKERRDLAERLYRELAQEGNPEKYVAQGMSGLAWLQWGREDGAAQSAMQFERLLKRFPDSPLAAEAAMMRGQSLEKMARPEGALAMYQLVMDRYAQSPHVSAAMLSAARILAELRQGREAEPLLRQWLERYSSSEQRPTALYQLAWVLVDLQRESEADEVFEEIHQQCTSSRYWSDATYRLAERAARESQYEQAEKLAAEIMQRAAEPSMVAYALYLRGQLAAAQQRWDDVVSWMRRLLDEHPGSSQKLPAEYWLAEAHYRLQQYDVAGPLFDQLDQQTADLGEAWAAMIPLRRAQIRAHQGTWDEAYDIAGQLTERFPQFAQRHEVDYLLGRYHASRAEFEQARAAYERVILSETGRATETAAVAQWMIGETYFMQKQYNQAIKAYHRVESLYNYPRWQAAALLQAGKCHEMVGRWSEAMDLYTRIVNEYGQTRFADQAAKRLRVAQQRADLMRTR